MTLFSFSLSLPVDNADKRTSAKSTFIFSTLKAVIYNFQYLLSMSSLTTNYPRKKHFSSTISNVFYPR